MEEPRKTVRARYLGSVEVPRATGMRVLNDALERLAAARAPSAWRPVAVAVAPSMITITEEGVSTICTAENNPETYMAYIASKYLFLLKLPFFGYLITLA